MIQFAYDDRNLAQADSLYRIFSQRFGGHPVASGVCYTMGKLYFREGKFDEAVKALRQVKGVQRVFPVLGRYDVVADVFDVGQEMRGQ
jgi:uncharacterized protein HemY